MGCFPCLVNTAYLYTQSFELHCIKERLNYTSCFSAGDPGVPVKEHRFAFLVPCDPELVLCCTGKYSARGLESANQVARSVH